MRALAVALLALACGLVGCRELSTQREGPAAPSAQPQASSPPRPSAEAVSSARKAEDLAAGQLRALHARHASGVPLHPAPGDGAISARLRDGSAVRIEGVHEDGRWFEVSQGAERGFITRRYLEPERERRPQPAASSRAEPRALGASSPFRSREACLAALARGEREPRAPGVARLGSWNLRWFPDGKPGKGENLASGAGSDVRWLACVIAYLDLDALAVQEIKRTKRAEAKLTALRGLLDSHQRGSFRVELDDCPEPAQHVGVIYDAKRVTRLGATVLGELNPHGRACQDQLRPGFAAFLRFRGGLDLHLASAHLKAGGEQRSFDLRLRSFAGLSEAYASAQALAADPDVLVLGDLNTMGCPECSPRVSDQEELARLDTTLAGEGFRRLPSDRACTHYYRERGGVLDGATGSLGFAELGREATLRVSGLCAALECQPLRGRPQALERLSDHCPIYVDIPDRDED